MRKIKNIVAIATVAVMAFSMAGCKMIEKTPAAIQKTVLAKVGNEKITMADVNSELKSDIDYLIQTYGKDYENSMDDTMKEKLKSARKSVLEQLVNDKVLITKVEKYYNENIDKYKKKAGANAKHILFKSEDEALAAKAKIDSGETTFDALFEQYKGNASGTFPKAEDLGYVENDKENFDTDFLAGFKQLKEGEISAPVKSSFGYHIIKVEGVQAEDTTTPLDEVKDSIKSTLETDKKKEVYNSTLEQWKKDLKVKTYENRL